MQRPGWIFLFGGMVGAVLAALVMIVGGWVWLAGLDASAARPAPAGLSWPLRAALERRLEREASGPPAPPAPSDRRTVLGFRQYDGACAACHGTPLEARAVWAKAMKPAPADLTEGPSKRSLRELYWLICRGETLSGMPAFGDKRSDDDIWNLALFVAALPDIKAERYQRMRAYFGPAPKPFDLTPNAHCLKGP
jgi:mono/diheme cytochrome c family protein